MTPEELQIRRAQLRKEFDALVWRHRRTGERLDALAKQLGDLDIEISVAGIRRNVPPAIVEQYRPLKMEIL